jgi:hypothetical protein
MAIPDQIAICSEALVLVGAEPITTLDGEDAASVVARTRYKPVVDARLSWAWGFNRLESDLARIAGPVPAGSQFDARFALPSDHFISIVPFINRWRADQWEEVDGHLWLDAAANDVVRLRYHGRVDEARWPPLFRIAVGYDLAAEFAVALREDRALATDMTMKAEIKLREARFANAAQAPGPRIELGRLGALRRR